MLKRARKEEGNVWTDMESSPQPTLVALTNKHGTSQTIICMLAATLQAVSSVFRAFLVDLEHTPGLQKIQLDCTKEELLSFASIISIFKPDELSLPLANGKSPTFETMRDSSKLIHQYDCPELLKWCIDIINSNLNNSMGTWGVIAKEYEILFGNEPKRTWIWQTNALVAIARGHNAGMQLMYKALSNSDSPECSTASDDCDCQLLKQTMDQISPKTMFQIASLGACSNKSLCKSVSKEKKSSP